MQVKNLFAQTFARISQESTKSAFEVRFNEIQRGLVAQREAEISKLRDEGVERDIERLQKQRNKLAVKSNALRDLQTDMRTNQFRFLEINETAQSAVNAADADNDQILTADEAAALNSAAEELFAEIHKLKYTHNVPDFTDGNLANRLRQDAETLAGLTAVAGAIDDDSVDPATNDNRDLLAQLTTIANRSLTYAESSQGLVEGLNQFIIDTQKNAFALEADLSELTTAKIAEQKDAIETIELRYNNLIRAISLSFEVQSGLADALVTGVQPDPPKGSILNLFA